MPPTTPPPDPRRAQHAGRRAAAPLLAGAVPGSEADEKRIKPLRILGEDLLVFRDGALPASARVARNRETADRPRFSIVLIGRRD